ncbi:MAG: 4'-phosphopantetheinyl transferase superfamily protein [Oscillospiraceae bacterium]|jgi:4'-phosphopantetheinyl transferase|nr:4'-phosphopantetheinyl transferase superfamily protein [Oscillospiraceae bacterium]
MVLFPEAPFTAGTSAAAVYIARTDFLSGADAYNAALLAVSDDRRLRAQRFHSRARAAQSLAAELLLRLALSELGCAEEPEFAVSESGKPYLANIPVRFSLSHTTGLAVCAVSETREVGADAERVRPANLKTAARVFSPAEYAAIASASGERRDVLFTAAWTRYEAAFKCGAEKYRFTEIAYSPGYSVTLCESV